MIVVAIVGVLAAIAGHGVVTYLQNAKTAEARIGVGRIANDAVAAFSRETMATAVLTPGTMAERTHRLCEDADAVPAFIPSASKYQSQPSDWQATGWRCLKFSMDSPQYYQYDYTPNGDAFEAIARGDLDGDAQGAVGTSLFVLRGLVNTRTGQATLAPAILETEPDE